MQLADSVVMTSVRNEGPFLLEWIAWYKMIGFENILIYHNDCTDHSPQMLRLLEKAGWITQHRQTPPEGEPPKNNAYRRAAKHKLVQNASWVFVCDVDEFLVVNTGDKTISALAQAVAPEHLGILINWMVFGSNGETEWQDGLVHQMFPKSGGPNAKQNSCFKAFYSRPRDFETLRSHGPKTWLGAEEWGQDGIGFCLADGARFDAYTIERHTPNSVPHDRIVHGLAQVNHYAVQSTEKFDLKRPHLSPAANKTRYTDDFFRRFDRNEETDTSALNYARRFADVYDAVLATPGVRRLHNLNCADLIERSALQRQQDPNSDPRFRHFKALAKSLPSHQDG